MDPTSQVILNAERAAHRDMPKDSLTLVCAVLVAQHRAIQDLRTDVELLTGRVDKLEPPW